MPILPTLLLTWLLPPVLGEDVGAAPDRGVVRGMTISCQTNGREWASDAFGAELDALEELGVNWVAIHPYAGIRSSGEVVWRHHHGSPPAHVVRPIREARARGISILIKPHLAYWGSEFSWRGEIDFEGEARARFWSSYASWIRDLAEVASEADAFAVGTELDRFLTDEAQWRELIADVRERTDAHLTYAANWTDFERVPFWDALDAIGVQAYFPLSQGHDPGVPELEEGWNRVVRRLRAVSRRTGKPVVLTEMGYNLSLDAARQPWSHRMDRGSDRERAEELQARCFRVALSTLEREREWLRGSFVWKWFVGPAPGENFLVDTPRLRRVLADAWR